MEVQARRASDVRIWLNGGKQEQRSLDDLVMTPETQTVTNLVTEEVLALRLWSGPQRHIYDAILGQLSTSELRTSREKFASVMVFSSVCLFATGL